MIGALQISEEGIFHVALGEDQGLFRDDLFFRLAQSRVELPPLSQRREDIELLAIEFLRRLPRDAPCARTVSREAVDELTSRAWPGNVRELKNVVERAAYMCDAPILRPADLVFDRLLERGREPPRPVVRNADEESSPDEDIPTFKGAKQTAVDDFEREYLARLMNKASGNIAVASGLAGIERHYVRTLLRKHGLYSRG